MIDLWPNHTTMLGTKEDISNTDIMYSNHPLIKMKSKMFQKRERMWRSHYVVMDLAINPDFGDGGLVVICETSRPHSVSSRRAVFVLVVFVAFILGLSVCVFIPVNFVGDHFPLTSRSKGSYDLTDKILDNSTEVVVARTSSVNSTFVDGIFWTELVEKLLPSGFSEEDEKQWHEFVQKMTIVNIEEGCGRMQNRLVTFEDGTKACCRYRQNTDQIQGEIFSYYLGRLLQLPNVVPSTAVAINSSDPVWRPIKAQLVLSHWAEDHPVVLTKYIQDLLPAYIPPALRHVTKDAVTSSTRGVLVTKRSATLETLLRNHDSGNTLQIKEWIKTEKDAIELAQWSDLVIFDYLTGNLDRLVNNLYNLQWNPDMLSNPAHNLARASSSDLLVFLDNESGMLHGYRLLDKYEPYHSLLLNSLCVFRKSTVDALSNLNLYSNPGNLLSARLPSPDLLPPLPDNNGNILRLRIAKVLHQVISCTQRS